MRLAYLGLFSKIFDWIFEKILSPIVKFIASLLSVVFEWIFENVLAPILTLVLKEIIPWIIDLLKELFAYLFYTLLAYLCKIVDYLQKAFDIFAGVSPVTDTLRVNAKGEPKTGPLIQIIMGQPVVTKIFVGIMAIGFVLAMMFTIIAVGKSVIDLDFEGKRPVGAVLRSFFKTVIQFMMVPLSVIIVIAFSTALLDVIDTATVKASGADETTLGKIVFCIASLDADKSDINNSSYYTGERSKDPNASKLITMGARGEIYKAKNELYLDSDFVMDSFNIAEFDYFTGYIAGVFLIIILISTALVFIQRVFDVVVLYIVSPVFVATMPIDEGERFGKWKDLFYGKVFSGYGAILGMKIYLLLIPVIMGNQIVMGDSSPEGAFLLKLLFLLGGAYATTKLGPMITSIISASAGAAEEATSGMASGFLGGLAVKGAMAGLGLAARGLGALTGGALGALGRGLGFGGDSKAIADQKFDKMKPKDPNKPGLGDKPGSKEGEGEGKSKKLGKELSDKRNAKENKDLKWDTKDGKAKSQNKFDKFLGKCHKVLPHKSNPDGSYSFSFLGFGVNYDKDGNRTGFKLPCTSFKYDKNGHWKCDSFKVPGIVNMQRRGSDGSFCVKDIPAIGLNRTQGIDGDFHVSHLGIVGLDRVEGMDGDFHTSHIGAIGYHAEEADNGQFMKTEICGIKFGYAQGADGNYQTNGVRVGNFIFGGTPNDEVKTTSSSGSSTSSTPTSTTTTTTGNGGGSTVQHTTTTTTTTSTPKSTVVENHKTVVQNQPQETVVRNTTTTVKSQPTQTIVQENKTIVQNQPQKTVVENHQTVVHQASQPNVIQKNETIVQNQPQKTVVENHQTVVQGAPKKTVVETHETVIHENSSTISQSEPKLKTDTKLHKKDKK